MCRGQLPAGSSESGVQLEGAPKLRSAVLVATGTQQRAAVVEMRGRGCIRQRNGIAKARQGRLDLVFLHERRGQRRMRRRGVGIQCSRSFRALRGARMFAAGIERDGQIRPSICILWFPAGDGLEQRGGTGRIAGFQKTHTQKIAHLRGMRVGGVCLAQRGQRLAVPTQPMQHGAKIDLGIQ